MNRRDLLLGAVAIPVAIEQDKAREIGHEIAARLSRCGSPFGFGGHSWACDQATDIVRRNLSC